MMKEQNQIPEQATILHNKIISEDGTVKFDFMTSLQNVVMAKILNSLWMNKTTQQEIVDLFNSHILPRETEFNLKWQGIENRVISRVSELYLPNFVTKKLKLLVPIVGKCIANWVRHHDEYIFNTTDCSSVDLIDNIKWTARGKIDYAETARCILANKSSCLTEDHKYILACSYCLEEEIAVLAPNVIKNQYYLDNKDIDIHPMIYFWTAHITGDSTKLYNPSYFDYNRRNSNMSINEHILQILIKNAEWTNRTFNEVPIRYMWSKLNAEEKAKNIKPLIRKLGNQDLRYTLLSNLDFDQQQDVFKECSGSILVDILSDWLWGDYFLPIALHVLDIMDPLAYLYILKEINKEKMLNSQQENEYIYKGYKFIFKKLWQKGSKNMKDFIFNHNNGRSLGYLITYSLSWEHDMDTIRLIFNDLNPQQKKNIIFEYDDGISHCAHLIKSDQWNLLELFINYALSSDEDIRQLKQRLVKDNGREIMLHFLEQEALDKAERFMSWAFNSEEESNQFRLSFAHIKMYESTLITIIAKEDVGFTKLDNHFKWCAKGNVTLINQFKAEIFKFSCSKKLIRKLTDEESFKLLEKVLNWCFLGNQKQIVQFKNMYKYDNLASPIRVLIYYILKYYYSFEMLDKFISWGFTNQQEILEFKIWLLYPLEGCCNICTALLCDYELELADRFINWCVTSSEEVSTFKNALMLSSHEMEDILNSTDEYVENNFQLLINWFNPSKDTLDIFFMLISENGCQTYLNFYYAVKQFIENQSN